MNYASSRPAIVLSSRIELPRLDYPSPKWLVLDPDRTPVHLRPATFWDFRITTEVGLFTIHRWIGITPTYIF